MCILLYTYTHMHARTHAYRHDGMSPRSINVVPFATCQACLLAVTDLRGFFKNIFNLEKVPIINKRDPFILIILLMNGHIFSLLFILLLISQHMEEME